MTVTTHLYDMTLPRTRISLSYVAFVGQARVVNTIYLLPRCRALSAILRWKLANTKSLLGTMSFWAPPANLESSSRDNDGTGAEDILLQKYCYEASCTSTSLVKGRRGILGYSTYRSAFATRVALEVTLKADRHHHASSAEKLRQTRVFEWLSPCS
jgi:hypothetical protein